MRRNLRASWASALCVLGLPALALAADPIATADGEMAGMTVQVHELKVSNGTAMLRFTIINNGTANFSTYNLTDHDVKAPDDRSASGVYLVDAANQKKYLVMYDTASQCVCSRGIGDIAPKSSVNLWAKFPAPPDSVKKIGVVVPHFQPIDDVPLSR
jgi:hypothetical protein